MGGELWTKKTTSQEGGVRKGARTWEGLQRRGTVRISSISRLFKKDSDSQQIGSRGKGKRHWKEGGKTGAVVGIS